MKGCSSPVGVDFCVVVVVAAAAVVDPLRISVAQPHAAAPSNSLSQSGLSLCLLSLSLSRRSAVARVVHRAGHGSSVVPRVRVGCQSWEP